MDVKSSHLINHSFHREPFLGIHVISARTSAVHLMIHCDFFKTFLSRLQENVLIRSNDKDSTYSVDLQVLHRVLQTGETLKRAVYNHKASY